MSYQKPAHVPDELFIGGNIWENMGPHPREHIKKLMGGRDLVFVERHVHAGKSAQGSWLTVSAEVTKRVLKDTETFSSEGATFFSTFLGRELTFFPVEVDPPEHAKYRAIAAPLFSAARVKTFESKIAARADAMIDELLPKGGCEFVSEFAKLFPAMFFLDLMGIDDSLAPTFLAIAKRALISVDPEEKTKAMQEARDFLRAEIEVRRAKPTDDGLSELANGQIDGRTITMNEAVGGAMVVFVAGLDTIATQLSWVFSYLAENPELQAQMRADTSNHSKIHEELLRYFASVMMASRIATQDIQIGDALIKKGDAVGCSMTLSCRDDREFDHADEVDFSIPPRRHLVFGHGVHTCIGLHLARLELRIVTQRWLERAPQFRIDGGPDFEFFCPGGPVFGLENLPLSWS